MKTTKRFIAALTAIVSVMAIAPMSAFADDTVINQDSTGKTGGMVVSYSKSPVSPAYTITIPASVDLNSTTRTATIKAEGVYLDTTKHSKINVTLDSASNTISGSKFHAKNTAGDSTATYSISKGETAVAVGDTVAEFTTGDGTATLTFSEPTGATYAGTHTETLTFGIAVENAVVTPKTYPSLKTGDILHVGDIVTSADSQSGYSFRDYGASFPKNYSFKLVRADISISGVSYAKVTESDTGAYYIFLDLSENEGSRHRNFSLSNVETQEELDDRTGKVIFKATETSDGLEVTVENGNKISFSVHEP